MRRWWLVLAVAGSVLLAGCGGIRVRDETPRQGSQGGGEEILRWQTLPVPYCLDLSEDGYTDDETFALLVERAFAAWGVASEDKGRCDGGLKEADQRNEIGWGAPPVPPGNGPGVYEAGYTRIRYRSCAKNCHGADSEVIEADIIVDKNAPRSFRNSRCLYSVLLHEIGHLLGLPHIEAPAVMASVTTTCPQNLTDADRRALQQRYAGDAPGP